MQMMTLNTWIVKEMLMVVITKGIVNRHTMINMQRCSITKIRRRKRKEKLLKNWLRNERDYNRKLKLMNKIKIKEMGYNL